MNILTEKIKNINEDVQIDLLFGSFDNNIGSTNLSKEQHDFINSILNKKYTKKKKIINNKYYYNNLIMIIQENKKQYYNVNNVLLFNDKNIIGIIKKKNYINEYEFPIISKYHKTTKNFINIYNYKNIISFLLITENEHINKFKIKINYSKNNFNEIKNELENIWDHLKKKFV